MSGCGCGCRGLGAVPTRSRMRRRARARAIGDAYTDALQQGESATETYVQAGTGVDVAAYVTEALQDGAEAKAAYDAVNAAVTALKDSDNYQATKDAMLVTEILATYLSTAVGVPMLGALFDAWFSQQPIAGEGPGVCGSDPPKDSAWTTLQAWPHYQSWGSIFGGYPVPAPGSFEEFANVPLEYNRALQDNCFADKAKPPMAVLAHLIETWNANHAASSQRTITRKGLNPSGWGVPPGYDPIAMALEASILYPPGYTGTVAAANQEYNATRSFVINTGPVILPKVLTFRAPAGHPLSTGASATGPSSAASSGSTGVALAVLGLGGAAAFYVHTVGAAGLPAWLRKLF